MLFHELLTRTNRKTIHRVLVETTGGGKNEAINQLRGRKTEP
jgi:hypothetical protein